MKALLAGLLLLAGCQDDIEMFPVNPGGGGPTSGTGRLNAAIDGPGDGGDTIAGRVCVLTDARQPTVCADTGAEDITVSLGNSTATTAADGSFTITRPAGSFFVWSVTGDLIAPSAMSFSTATTIPAIDATVYEQMRTANQAVQSLGNGAVIAQILRGTTPVTGLTATTFPEPEGLTYFYDGSDATNWSGNVTGPFGTIWVPGVPPGGVDLFVHGVTTDETLSAIPVRPDTVTFVSAVIP